MKLQRGNPTLKYKTLRQRVEMIASKGIAVAQREYFCILCEGDIEKGEEYYYGSRYNRAHKHCVEDAMESLVKFDEYKTLMVAV